MNDNGNDTNLMIKEFEDEMRNEPSLSQISIATTTQSSSLLLHSDNSFFDSVTHLNSTMNQNGEDEMEEKQVLEKRNSDSALSKSTFHGMMIDERHSNYVLMYDMLTGIRISVSRCQAKPSRDLISADYTSTLHLAFDSSGNEFTPSSKYDFKFKDYTPWIFRSLREAFGIDAADYLVSKTFIILDITDWKICLIRARFSRKEWELFLLLTRFSIHHKNYKKK